jgi:hypothetical protein
MIQPEPVKLVAQIVVVVNVLPGFRNASRAGVVVAPQGFQPFGPFLPGVVN